MPVAIALLRGVNVGGKHALPMVTLREVCEGLRWRDVATLIQSGNVVFRCERQELAKAGEALRDAVQARMGFGPEVVVRSAAEMRAALEACPFEDEGKRIVIMFLAGVPSAAARKAVEALRPEPERVAMTQREVYAHYPLGIGTSKFAFTKVEKAVGVPGTARNLNTVIKLVEMADALEA